MYWLYDEMIDTVPKEHHWYPMQWGMFGRYRTYRVEFARTSVANRIARLG